jgi:hypothetical protein
LAVPTINRISPVRGVNRVTAITILRWVRSGVDASAGGQSQGGSNDSLMMSLLSNTQTGHSSKITLQFCRQVMAADIG